MSGKLDVMRTFQSAYMSGGPEQACRRHLSEDFELHEPPELPQGGRFTGWDAPLRVSAIYTAIWDIELLNAEFFDVPDGDLVVSRYLMKWTHKATGKTMTQPIVELNTIVGGKITKMEVFHFDAAGLLATMR
jgi:hypothetical protein